MKGLKNIQRSFGGSGWGSTGGGGGGGATILTGLTDVTITSPADNQQIRYDFTSGKWINFTPTATSGVIKQWVVGDPFLANDIVKNGQFLYVAQVGNTGNNPTTDNGTNWKPYQFPLEILMLVDAIGPIKSKTIDVTPMGGGLTTQLESGSIVSRNGNTIATSSVPQASPMVFDVINSAGVDQALSQTELIVNQTDVGAIVGNDSGIHRVYLHKDNGNVKILRPQEIYTSFDEAKYNFAAYDPIIPVVLDDYIHIQSIIAAANQTDTLSSEIQFINTGKLGDSIGTGGGASSSDTFIFETLTVTAQNTVSNLANLPKDDATVIFFVDGNMATPGISSAGGVITVNSATLGYNVETFHIVKAYYFY